RALPPFPTRRSSDLSQGEFRVLARVQDGRFAPGEEWPVIDDIDATLLFERDRMEITGRRGRILGATVSDVKVEIASFLAPEVHRSEEHTSELQSREI